MTFNVYRRHYGYNQSRDRDKIFEIAILQISNKNYNLLHQKIPNIQIISMVKQEGFSPATGPKHAYSFVTRVSGSALIHLKHRVYRLEATLQFEMVDSKQPYMTQDFSSNVQLLIFSKSVFSIVFICDNTFIFAFWNWIIWVQV